MTATAVNEQLHHPAQWEVFKDAAQVESATADMAARLVGDYAGRIPLYIALLEGGRYFAERLAADMTSISTDVPDLQYLKVSTYGESYTARTPTVDIQALASIVEGSPRDRSVVIVDDVLDSGVTMAFMDKLLRTEYGFTDVASVVLVEKQIERGEYPAASFKCFTAEKAAWLAGCGMDDKDEPNARVLPYVVAKLPQQEQAA